MSHQKKKVAVIGAGVGGLATAARLAHAGYLVEVFEKMPRPGGRNYLLEDQGFKFDMGPSFVLMPEFFREVFASCGEDIAKYLDLKVLDINYKIFYPDGNLLTVFRDMDKTKHEMETFEPGCSQSYDLFIEQTGRFFKLVEPLLYKCFRRQQLFDPQYWPLLFKLKPFYSYWDLARHYFQDRKLCYALTFEAMFMGVSPFQAPSFYSIITYSDHVQKIAHPMGGMYQIPLALEKMARERGAVFHYDTEVKKIEKRGSGLALNINGQQQEFPFVVVNADYPYSQTNLLGRSIPNYRYSCSVYLLYLGLKQKLRGLDHHNLFFADDLELNLQQIFEDNVVPQDPSFYIHVPTVTDPGLAPKGKEIVYVLVPVANLKEKDYDIGAYEGALRRVVFEKINKVTGTRVEDLIEVEHKFIPQDFTTRYNIKFGSTFGLAHNLFQSAFFRPANIDAEHDNLFYVGASTQPGGGLPVVLASSRIVSDLIQAKG